MKIFQVTDGHESREIEAKTADIAIELYLNQSCCGAVYYVEIEACEVGGDSSAFFCGLVGGDLKDRQDTEN